MKLILTPTLKIASNDKERQHLYELLAQRITQYVEPHYVSDDMLRGHQNEQIALDIYAEKYAQFEKVGFITEDKWGFTIGYSPDGLVGSDGLLEVKSRRQKYQLQTICDYMNEGEIFPEYVMQAQTGLLVTGRKWLDHITYCGGLPLAVTRVYPDAKIQTAIIEAAAAFETRLAEKLVIYNKIAPTLAPTERLIEQEMEI